MRSKLFVVLFIIAAITFFTKEHYRGITDIHPEVLREPEQTEVASEEPFIFNKDGFAYRVTPLQNYDISGLVVHRQTYNAWYSISRIDRVFPVDLCMIWGENVRSGAYQNSDAKFTQDSRFCYFLSSGGKPIINEAVSNNHLVIQISSLEKVAKAISAGDQVRIRGKLVNVEARPLTSPEKYEPDDLVWDTSVVRDDVGEGADETIYVESIEILKQGNPVSHWLFNISFYVLIAILLSGTWDLLRVLFSDPMRSKFVGKE